MLGLAFRKGVTVNVERMTHVGDGRQHGPERASVVDQATDRHPPKAHAMIAPLAADKARTLTFTPGAVIGECDLQSGVHRLSSGVHKKDAV